MPTNIPADLALRLSVLFAALGAITAEDLVTIRNAETLGPDVATNIEAMQKQAISLDDETVNILNQARTDAGLPPV